MKNVVAFDLETIADKQCIPLLPEVKANKSLKDQAKIAMDIEAKKIQQIADMGLNPHTNIICCISFCSGTQQCQSVFINEPTHKAEKALIESAWKILSKYDHFVTFNGRSFDLKCLLFHGITYGIRPTINIDKGRYNRGNHTDLREVFAGSEPFAKGTMDFFCKRYLAIGKMEGINGSMVQDYFDNELFDDIKRYCEDDASKTYSLFVKAKTAGLLE